ncbi:hypothetical protein Shyd_19060 [Streptomyces hydrogenans]|uniref:Uncharacterized protein n=1 Tax=Streptomyces hydrogenans TaxID=1873719 RepID=A0ABQ3P693_9ACTN|nr:hypothetical protein Shyd_19060 [Streptomyces hydrogenans]
MTPLGTPVVPEEYGRAATSSPGAKSSAGSGAVDPRKDWSERVPPSSGAASQTKISSMPPASSAAARAAGSSGETVTIQRAAESRSCLANLLGRGERVDGRDGGAGAGGGVERHGEQHRVGAVQREHVALAHPRLREARRHAPVESVHLRVRQRQFPGPVDQRGRVPEGRGAAEDGLVDGEGQGGNRLVRAVEHHAWPPGEVEGGRQDRGCGTAWGDPVSTP